MARIPVGVSVSVATAGLLVHCGLIVGNGTYSVGRSSTDGGSVADAQPTDGKTVITYSVFTDPANWSTVDLTDFDTDSVPGFIGGAYDNQQKYIYLAPNGGTMVRYNTQSIAGFSNTAASWESFQLYGPSGGPGFNGAGFAGCVYAQGYVFYIPNHNPYTFAASSRVYRYDTSGSFTDSNSWASAVLSTLYGSNAANAFYGGVVAGNYLYIVPYGIDTGSTGTTTSGLAARYDLTQPTNFAATSQDGGSTAWTFFDLGASFPKVSNVSVGGFQGGLYDQRYVYFVPNAGASVAMRYDTTGLFTATASWSSFDTSQSGARPWGFLGGAIGPNGALYLSPNVHNGTPLSLMQYRYDPTDSTFTNGWQSFDTRQLNLNPGGFAGAAIDNRFVYFVPFANTVTGGRSSTYNYNGVVAQLDTQASADAGVSAWNVFDMSTLSPNAVGFTGAVFDGSYIYFIPNRNMTVVRYFAQTPQLLPSGYTGSFL